MKYNRLLLVSYIIMTAAYTGVIFSMDSSRGTNADQTPAKWVPSTETNPDNFKRVPLLDTMHEKAEKSKLTFALVVDVKKRKDVGPHLAALFVTDHLRTLSQQVAVITERQTIDDVELLEHAFAGIELVSNNVASCPPGTYKNFQDLRQKLIKAHGKKIIACAQHATLNTIDQGRSALKILDVCAGMLIAIYAQSSKDIVAAREHMQMLEQELLRQDGYVKKQKKSLAALRAAFACKLETLVPHIRDNTLTFEMVEEVLRGTTTVYADSSLLRGFCEQHKEALYRNAATIAEAKKASFEAIAGTAAGLALILESRIDDAKARAQFANLIKSQLKVLKTTVSKGARTTTTDEERAAAQRALALLIKVFPIDRPRTLSQSEITRLFLVRYEKALSQKCAIGELLDEPHKELSKHLQDGTLTGSMVYPHWGCNILPPIETDDNKYACCWEMQILHEDQILEQVKKVCEGYGAHDQEIEHAYIAVGFLGMKINNWRKKIIEKYAHILRTAIGKTADKIPTLLLAPVEEPLLTEAIRARAFLNMLKEHKNTTLFGTWKSLFPEDSLFPGNSFDELYSKLTAAIEGPRKADPNAAPDGTADAIGEKPESPIKGNKTQETKKTTTLVNTDITKTNKGHTTSTWHLDRRKLNTALKWVAGMTATAALVAATIYYYKKQNKKPVAKAG